jgi:DNA-binding winged helix-turn-helix (wHTH) protein
MAGSEVYEFAGLRLNVPERLLSRGDNGIAVAPKSFDLLVALVRKAGRLAAKRELLDLVWPETFVEEGILSVHISAIRKALGEERDRQYIETVSRAGYRFIADVKRLSEDESASERQSIAVLPARPLIGELFSERDRHTGLAIADALIDRLGRCPNMVLRPARAVRDYVNADDDPAAIGRSLAWTPCSILALSRLPPGFKSPYI